MPCHVIAIQKKSLFASLSASRVRVTISYFLVLHLLPNIHTEKYMSKDHLDYPNGNIFFME